MENVSCALCGRDETTTLARKGIFKKNGPVIKFINVICKNCGLVYRNPRQDKNELSELYKKIYLEKRHSFADEAGASAFVKNLDQKNKGEQIADFLIDFLKPKTRILDVGSGLGLVSGYLKNKFGLSVLGIEPSELSGEIARKIYGIEVFSGTLDDYMQKRKEDQKFDCIILHHVFEHFGEPLAKLEELKSLLAPEGVLYIEVPNVIDFKKPISQFFDLLHLYNYSPATLWKMLKAGGYKIIKWNRDKKFRLQVMAAPLTHQSREILLSEKEGSESLKHTFSYCRKKRLRECLNFLLDPFRRIKQFLK